MTGSSPWLLSRRADLLLFGGSTLLALGLLVYGSASGDLLGDCPPWLWLASVVGVDVAHVWSTGWRVYADPGELAARRSLYVAVPAAAYVGGVMAHAVSPMLFWRLLAYAAVIHFVRQQYGWVALYRRKNGEGPEGRRLDAWTIYAATIVPLVYWHAHLPRRFHWFLAGDFVPGLPSWAGTAALAAFPPLLAAFLVKEARRRLQGQPVSTGKILIVLSTALTWFLGIVILDSDYAFTVTNVLVHGIPYVGLVLVTSRARAAQHAERGQVPTLADRAARSLPLFVLPLVLVAFAEEWGWDRLVWHDNGAFFPGPDLTPGPGLLSLLVPLLALPQATHYALDAFIWKVRPENAPSLTALGVPVEPAGAAR